MYKILLFFVLVIFGACTARAEGATALYLEFMDETQYGPESEVPVRVLVNSSEPVNAFAFSILYSSDILQVRSIDTSASIVDFWVHDPDTRLPGAISFEGGASAPFTGLQGEVATVYFRSKTPGTAHLSISEPVAIKADGAGTRIDVDPSVAFLTVSEDGVVAVKEGREDTIPPRFEEVTLAVNPIENTSMIVFQTEDISGVRETEVRFRSGIFWSGWMQAVNPVRLPAGVFVVQFRATDMVGNVSFYTKYVPEEIIRKITQNSLFFSICVLVLAFGFVGIIIRRRIARE